MKKILTALIFLGWSSAHAQILTEMEATPSVLSEPSALILITEVSFKNSTADWVKIHYQSPSNKPANLKGLGFADDKIFKTIEEDFIIASGQDILLTFKSEEADTMPYLYSSRSGLTGTTEQIILYDQDGSVLDAVCWTSSSPTEGEIKEQAELFELEGWHSSDINSCLLSDNIAKEESIIRNGLIDTNSAGDWITPQPEPTPTEIETPTIQEVTTPTVQTPTVQQTETPLAPQPIIAPDIVAVTTPQAPQKEEKTSKSEKSSSSSNYSNGQLSTEVFISEILPNPEGTDTKKEWVELTNPGETAMNLGNWQLDDGEDGSKPYTIPDSFTLQPGQALTISTKDSKLSLGNKEDSIRLFNYQGELVHQIDYEEAPSGQSYSSIIIEHEDGTTTEEWIWTENLTPDAPNPQYQQFQAKVITEPEFKEQYFFEVQDTSGEAHTIIFDESNIAGPLAKATFTTGTSVLLTIEPEEKRLISFEVIGQAVEQSHFPPIAIPVIIGTLLILAAGTFYMVHKKIPWQQASNSV
ncbi:MAG: lamin tail domain-containing protein [Candidatus Gracilibacteria bacterium]|nr:lamin tail domain-containing protein [Candidatus Peregrinibacteria bacterium]